jgi:muramoyltetrapeptide carboxypeptidase LdcA involved in peptidoglycan recycling
MSDFVVPDPLDPGDTVAIVAPSSGGARDAPQVFEQGLRRLREVFDLRPRVHPTARQGNDFLAAHPNARAAAIHELFRDPTVDGVIATIGGSDQLRILSHLDPSLLREHPTRFYGMSDNTTLCLALWAHGIVSYNGAQLMNEIAVPGSLPAYTERYCRRAFFEDVLGELTPSREWTDEPASWADREGDGERQTFEPNDGWIWRGGDRRVHGRIWGGCSEILHWHLAADRFVPTPDEIEGDILAMETAEDLPTPDRVRSRLMCMGERGLLERFGAVMVGRAPGQSFLERRDKAARDRYRSTLRDAIAEEVARYNPDAPIIFDLDWGHTTPIVPLPIGGEVIVDPADRSIRFPGHGGRADKD